MIQQLQMFHIRAKIQAKEKPDKVKIDISDFMQKFDIIQSRLAEDFQMQAEFKCLHYFNLVVQWLKLIKVYRSDSVVKDVNKYIAEVMTIVRQSNAEGNERFILSIFNFWKDIISNFLPELTTDSIEVFFTLFKQMDKLQTTSRIEATLEVM